MGENLSIDLIRKYHSIEAFRSDVCRHPKMNSSRSPNAGGDTHMSGVGRLQLAALLIKSYIGLDTDDNETLVIDEFPSGTRF